MGTKQARDLFCTAGGKVDSVTVTADKQGGRSGGGKKKNADGGHAGRNAMSSRDAGNERGHQMGRRGGKPMKRVGGGGDQTNTRGGN